MDSPAPSTPGLLRRGLGYELALYQQPKVFLAALALIFVPALYVLIYVSSVWDPYANLARLPGALVNQDLGDHRAGREINLGTQVAEKLEREKPFAFVRFATPATARAAVQQGQVFFALLIPPDFSRRALAAGQPAQLGLYVSEGGNYTASLLTKRFATELAHQVNEQLGRERWSQLVGRGPPDAPTLAEGLDALRAGAWRVARGSATLHEGSRRLDQGLDRAAAGAKQIAAGTPKLAVASDQLTGGMKQVASAVDSIRAKLPADEKLRELAQGSEALVHGAGDLQTGLGQVREGTSRLETGAGQLQAGAAQVPFGGGKLSAGAGQLHTGAKTLGDGVARAAAGAGRLHEGQAQLNAAVQPLTAGLIELNGGLRTMREKLPAPAQLDLFNRSVGEVRDGAQALSTGLGELQAGSVRLTAGLGQLETGSGQLAAGLDEAAARFTTGFGGSLPSLLAAPVEPAIEVVAPVPHNGWAFAPYFASLSLWVGAVMMSFVFHLRRLPDPLRPAGRPTRWLVKAAPLLGLGALQAAVVVGVLRLMGLQFAHPLAVWLVATAGSLTFVCLIVLLLTLLGDAGRLLAIVLLILQLAASGGVYPVELSPPFYPQVHGYLPFSHLVHAFRATMFAAFDSQWQPSLATLGGFALAAALLGMLLARWKYLPRESYGPAVEF